MDRGEILQELLSDFEPGECPICHEQLLEYNNEPFFSGDIIYFPYECDICGFKGRECFLMEFLYHTDENGGNIE